jgi:hypothetical protein
MVCWLIWGASQVPPDKDAAWRPIVLALLTIVAAYSLIGIWLATAGKCGGEQEAGVIAFYSIIYAYFGRYLPIVVIPVGLWALFRFTAIAIPIRKAAIVTAVLLVLAFACGLIVHTTGGCPPVGM